jgi:ATP phosphoribosyltransferase regulatory subunit
MIYQPPTGARDLLPLDVAQKRWIEDRLQQVFHRWGYHRIITSTLERLDTLMAGGAIDRASILSVQAGPDEALGLRPELTASIARIVVTRLGKLTFPQRLYYNANVFSRPTEDSHSAQQEFYQAGVELLGSGELLADAEMLLLVIDCLANLGLGDVAQPQWQIIVGEASLTQSLLSVFPENLRQKVRYAIAHLDLLMLDQLGLEDQLRDLAMQLLDLRGEPSQVLAKISRWPVDDQQQHRVNRLKTLFELLQQSVGGAKLPIVLDLSLIRTFDYYTGLVFEVASVSDSGLHLLAQGGRYDSLLGQYHPQGEDIPGIGFSFQIEQLHQVLLTAQQLPQQVPTSDWLVVAAGPAQAAIALAYAKTLRQTDEVRVELQLEQADRETVLAHAKTRKIGQIAWIKGVGEIVVESV